MRIRAAMKLFQLDSQLRDRAIRPPTTWLVVAQDENDARALVPKPHDVVRATVCGARACGTRRVIASWPLA